MRDGYFVPADVHNGQRTLRQRRRHILANGSLATLGAALLFLSFSAGPAGRFGAPALRPTETARTIPAPQKQAQASRYDAQASALLFGGPTIPQEMLSALTTASIAPQPLQEATPSTPAPVQVASVEPAIVEPVESETAAMPAIPYPPQRPTHLRAQGRSIAMRTAPGARAPRIQQPAEEPGFFQRIFGGMGATPAQQQETATPRMMAYAPVGGVTEPARAIPPASPSDLAPRHEKTAYYVIEDRAVYMPDGSRLEAHSGLGPKKDDPRFVHVRMNGSTPPNVYNLTMRERLFHGVEAIRMLPVHRDKMFGRDGILAHSYLLGPGGDSHGCVSFKDYSRFLNAFKRGEVTRIVVVANNSSMLAMNTRR